MNLVSFSIKTKGLHNFTRRLWTVFARFGISEARTRRHLYAIMRTVQKYGAGPTFYIPAVVLQRHPRLIQEIERDGAEIGIHGYIHNDYRFLSEAEQYKQTDQAIKIFKKLKIAYYGFRNPYLGWNESALRVFKRLGFSYETNEAILHDVIDQTQLTEPIVSGYKKSLTLFQAIECNAYTLRPHFEEGLLRIPTCIPDDEMLFDRLRITQAEEVGKIWSEILQRAYDLGGIYTLNLHPERGLLCQRALEILLESAQRQPHPIWITKLEEVASWWKERQQGRIYVQSLAPQQWHIEAACSERTTLLARSVTVENQEAKPWSTKEISIAARSFNVQAAVCPCIGISQRTPQCIMDVLIEQGYAVVRPEPGDKAPYACVIDRPEGPGGSRAERRAYFAALIGQIEQSTAPLIHFGCWPLDKRAALAISGDIDSVTIQDFFLRVLEVRNT